ncbi:MAG: outer membrane protein assembly factor BamD [Gammaproteobacteria bacterium]|jgi:outer membrane protein assembly factor BamD|nr:outer membrane protein assembly factor BamD [Gammaproteobacteria bacterium]
MRLLILFLLIASLFSCAGADKDETADYTAKQLYDEAQQAINSAEFETAVKHLEALEARYPFDPYAKQAQLDIAYAYYKFDELDSASSALDRFARLHPRDPHMDYVYYLKGLINFNRGQGLLDAWFPREPSKHDPAVLEQAFNDFDTLVRRYPNSVYAGDAHQRMIYLRNQMAEKEILIAKFYMQRKSWLSSAKRAKAVIERYPNTKWTKDALEILLLSYQKLELYELAADTQRVIDYNDFSDITTTIDPDKYGKAPPSTL